MAVCYRIGLHCTATPVVSSSLCQRRAVVRCAPLHKASGSWGVETCPAEKSYQLMFLWDVT
jgi:hypothetical protein